MTIQTGMKAWAGILAALLSGLTVQADPVLPVIPGVVFTVTVYGAEGDGVDADEVRDARSLAFRVATLDVQLVAVERDGRREELLQRERVLLEEALPVRLIACCGTFQSLLELLDQDFERDEFDAPA